MKKIVLYIIVMAAALMVPVERADIGKLRPVEVVYVSRQGTNVRIETDTKDAGMGVTPEEAFQNLKDTTGGIIFLDTADYLLLDQNAVDLLNNLTPYLKSSVRVCEAVPDLDLEMAAAYLSVHKPGMKLKERGSPIEERLICEDGRMKLIKKPKNNA